MSKEQNVLKYYVLCNKLKDVIRTGWKDWHVKRARIESVAEHIYGVQMLAIAMNSEYQYNIDITKVIMMLAVHELEEILIGDLTQFQISKAEKLIIGHEAIEKVLSGLTDKNEIKNLILEFDERKTKEALFAHYCDKLECDLQCKLYDEENCVDIENEKGINDPKVQEMLETKKSWSELWIKYDQQSIGFDENFMSVSNYAIQNNIKSLTDDVNGDGVN